MPQGLRQLCDRSSVYIHARTQSISSSPTTVSEAPAVRQSLIALSTPSNAANNQSMKTLYTGLCSRSRLAILNLCSRLLADVRRRACNLATRNRRASLSRLRVSISRGNGCHPISLQDSNLVHLTVVIRFHQSSVNLSNK